MGVETTIYVYVHNHFRLIDLPWDNPFTWYAALLTVDFAYYWAHRASHGKLHKFAIYHSIYSRHS